jgi:hypothetical protein
MRTPVFETSVMSPDALLDAAQVAVDLLCLIASADGFAAFPQFGGDRHLTTETRFRAVNIDAAHDRQAAVFERRLTLDVKQYIECTSLVHNPTFVFRKLTIC